MFNFEKLDTSKDAIAFSDVVYRITRNFPDCERFGLSNQIRRAAVSISSNIAEDCSRSSRRDYARFVEIATGSLFEVISQATVGLNQALLTADEYRERYSAGEKQSRTLTGLRKSLAASARPAPASLAASADSTASPHPADTAACERRALCAKICGSSVYHVLKYQAEIYRLRSTRQVQSFFKFDTVGSPRHSPRK